MRGLSKPWPPKDVIPDGQTPRRFVDVEREYLTTLLDRPDRIRFARTEFDQFDKGKLRPQPAGSPSAAAAGRRCASGSRPAENFGFSLPRHGRTSSRGWQAS